ncbi:MAG: 2,3-bisphosphoglycerate-independent phosphoglycerate mutase [candidate division Zixibacteria bacterium]|nr:2,3-bisphosphoglycerate-independent phosphoglycerate mutase [candidate division Zixibacteria bacterium]
MTKRPVTLIIMDGFGINPSDYYNAVKTANTPNIDKLWNEYPHTTLGASGLSVGLPDGQMGNSEVGHLNFGAGRVVYQEVTRIDKSISDGELFTNPVFNSCIEKVIHDKKSLHLMGLLSDGCVHSSMNHLYGILKLCRKHKLDRVYIHAFLDGRDTSPYSGASFIKKLLKKTDEIGVGKLSTVIGRYYAMDRDNRWERNKIAYDLLCGGKGEKTDDFITTVKEHYERENTDEFMESIVSSNAAPNAGLIASGDGVIFFNFRSDRARQISKAFTEENFKGFKREPKVIVNLVSMTHYADDLKAEVAYPQVKLDKIFPEVISEAGLKQLKIAETEKYPHVTFFFNGGVERMLEGEDRCLIPSPKVATYDLQPEMSAPEITAEVLKRIESNKYDVIILNFANCDMVGHTGIFEAAVKAVETVDENVAKVVKAVKNAGGIVMITADHGNAEKMKEDNGEPFTAHTTFEVPFILVDDDFRDTLKSGGVLADVAPTMLKYLGIEQPEQMTGKTLLKKVSVVR